MTRLAWPSILEHAAAVVAEYTTGVTLRQAYYRLVADGTLPNTRSYYQRLSEYTAKARRDGWFPDLLDRTSGIERYMSFNGLEEGLNWFQRMYRRPRTIGQPWTVYLGVEKAGMSAQLDQWFTDPLDIPHIALGGFASQTLCDQVRRDIERQERPAALVYAGDHDPSGEDVDRDFVERVGVFDKTIRVALNADQLTRFGIPTNQLDPEVEKKLANDSRAARFRERHGYLDQYEVDAVEPTTLRDLYRDAVEQFWDQDAYEDVLAQEAADLDELAGRWSS